MLPSLQRRVDERIREWDVVVDATRETRSSHIVFGTRGDRGVVLKVIREVGDEWQSGDVLHAFGGHGVARVYEHIEGAMLLERLEPATALADVTISGRDEYATEVIADVIRRMSNPSAVPTGCATVHDWGDGFSDYRKGGDQQIPIELVDHAERLYLDLAMSQRHIRLLHGDLHHYNILFDSDRHWLAIDPKGVLGELEYEVGAALRNPCENPEAFASRVRIETRIARFEAELKLNPDRMLAWGFAQAVLSAIWAVEDGAAIDSENPGLRLARAIRPMLTQSWSY